MSSKGWLTMWRRLGDLKARTRRAPEELRPKPTAVSDVRFFNPGYGFLIEYLQTQRQLFRAGIQTASF